VRKTKEWLGKCKIGTSDKRETAKAEVRKGFGYTAEADHLFRAISRAALISGTSVRNGSALSAQPSQRMDVAEAVSHPAAYHASTSSVFAR
jgi:hypothetical protein